MAKYILKSSGGYVGTDNEMDISEWFDDDMFEEYESGENRDLNDELLCAAIEMQGFEWYVEKKESENE